MEKIERGQRKYFKQIGIDSYQTLACSDFEWACDECLHSGKAIPANPEAQENACEKKLSYSDEVKICQKCGSEFLFSKNEKKTWYESYRFHLDSTPVNCLKCRREVREVRAENKILSDTLKKGEKGLSVSDLNRVKYIYQKWDKPEKVSFYKALIKKASAKR